MAIVIDMLNKKFNRLTILKQVEHDKSNNVYLEINNEVKTLSNWLIVYDIKRSTYNSRIQRGWNQIEAIITPLKNKKGENNV